MAAAVEYPLCDLALSRRLERAEGSRNAAFVAARAAIQPGSGAGSIAVAGTLAMFDGPDSPITQTFGLGLFEPAHWDVLNELERFFLERGAPVHHEVSPLADPDLLPRLNARGYRPVELSSVLCRPTAGGLPEAERSGPEITVRPIAAGEVARWVEVTAQGWEATGSLDEFLRDFGPVITASAGSLCYVAERAGEWVGTAALGLDPETGVAVLAGACTVPSARRQGVQRALLRTRLRDAAAHGCELALMASEPGSGSQRNAERQGFRIAYTRIKWRYKPPTTPPPA